MRVGAGTTCNVRDRVRSSETMPRLQSGWVRPPVWLREGRRPFPTPPPLQAESGAAPATPARVECSFCTFDVREQPRLSCWMKTHGAKRNRLGLHVVAAFGEG